MIHLIKKVLPKNIAQRFFIILIAPVALSQLIFAIIFFGKYTDKVITTISNQIAGDIKVICVTLDQSHKKDMIEFMEKSFDVNISVLKNTQLKKRGLYRKTKLYRILRNSLIKKHLFNFYIKPKDAGIIILLSFKNNVYKVYFKKQKLYTKFIPIVLGWGIASSIVLIIIAFLFLKNQIRPIKRLAQAAKHFGEGVDNNDFVPEGAREVKMAGIAFCEMKTNFRKLLNNRLQTLAGVSHDLKTPLTKMKLQLSLMPKSKEVLGLLQDVNMMIEITKSFSLHANQQIKETFSSRNLFLLLLEIAQTYESQNFRVYITGDKRIEIQMRYVSLKRAISNIFSNAKSYATNLYIQFVQTGDKVKITFEDNGPGIQNDLLDTIFSPFVSENAARTQNGTANVGLGLSIARDSIIDHGGTIKAYNSKNYKGACFLIEIPVS
ncbi:MAG: hypothetical protein LBE97_00800 [Holosporales bacterium]|jgi:two-component system osmolarity sensor histidine kinase EnvZ|nr:hypothetical protein [Holosporales bacterium]